jgi:hypothetical protein
MIQWEAVGEMRQWSLSKHSFWEFVTLGVCLIVLASILIRGFKR